MRVRYSYKGRPMVSLEAALNAFKMDVMLGAMAITRHAARQLAYDIKAATPVRTGRAAENWQLTLNGQVHPYNPLAVGDGRGPVQVDDLGSMTPYDRITLVNPTPYAIQLEFGSSDQAPTGMVRTSVMSWSQYVALASIGKL